MVASQRDESDRKGEHASRIRNIIEDCICRRAAGESLSDEQLVAAHADLMPELGAELTKLALIEDANRQARETVVSQAMRGGVPPAEPTLPQAIAFPGYRVLGEIHRGGQGVVYRAIQESTERSVAIKLARHGRLTDSSESARLGSSPSNTGLRVIILSVLPESDFA